MEPLTKEQLVDIEDRRSSFLYDFKELRDKFEVDFLAIPVFTMNEGGTFDVRIKVDVMDLKYAPKPSPFIQ